ncbi:hypothetical protein FSOLCH5_007895 [Fusarium solani]
MGTKYAHGRSFTNPDGRNNNCVATALARMEGFENADQFQEDMIGWRFGDPQFGQGLGMSPDDVEIFRTETGRKFKKETFTPTATQSAYDVMKASFNPIGPESLLDYTQPGGMGHAVNMYHDLERGTSTIEDFQRSNFGERMEQHVQHATKIDIWSPLPETTAEELESAREREGSERSSSVVRASRVLVNGELRGVTPCQDLSHFIMMCTGGGDGRR